jgi:hypothetical protein
MINWQLKTDQPQRYRGTEGKSIRTSVGKFIVGSSEFVDTNHQLQTADYELRTV